MITYSLIIPVYKNEESLPLVITTCEEIHKELNRELEVVFIIDGSPDRSYEILKTLLPKAIFCSQLISLSRNFGSFTAIRAGLTHARGDYFAIMAADLQEPSELILTFFNALKTGTVDVTIGTRRSRKDQILSGIGARLFWIIFRGLVMHEVPPGGVDIFGCNKIFRNHLLSLKESNSSLVGLLFWIGFRRQFFSYDRSVRIHGKSAWKFSKKIKYLLDSIFAFTDLPIRILTYAGILGLIVSVGLSFIVLISKLTGIIEVPGYSATVLVITFFAALNSFGLGIIGSYVWRTFENTKQRPPFLLLDHVQFEGAKRE